jgi:hypothetical protein
VSTLRSDEVGGLFSIKMSKIKKKIILKSTGGKKNYKAGWRAEHRAIDLLKSYGYMVIRSAKSGGPFDLIAFNETQFVLVQVKLCQHGKLLSYKKTKDYLRSIAVPLNCKKELWVYERRFGWHHFSL